MPLWYSEIRFQGKDLRKKVRLKIRLDVKIFFSYYNKNVLLGDIDGRIL